MAKDIEITGIPDDVHEALVDAAAAQGMSLTTYLRSELSHLARRAQAVRHNADVVRRTQAEVGGTADRDTILAVLEEGRGD
ncbi:MAG: hypothetical protein ACRCSN_05270 [Dermatophilaceae bacterium]